MARQEILDRVALTVVIDEWVLYRQIGNPEVMRGQLDRLTETTIRVQVIPEGTDAYAAYEGGLIVATHDGVEVVHLDTAIRGFLFDNGEVLSEARRRFEILRGEALPPRQSRELIAEVRDKRWNSNH